MSRPHPIDGREVPEPAYVTREDALARARRAAEVQQSFRRTSFAERATMLRAAAGLLRERRDPIAATMTDEMGKPLTAARSEVDKCALCFDHYAEHGEAYLAHRPIETDAKTSYVAYQPLGVVLAIMPWNFPLWQVVRFGAPALMAGNGFVLKHAPNVPGCAAAILKVLDDAGLPEGLVADGMVDTDDVEALIEDDAIAAVTLTGSTRAGRAVARIAGGALKPCVLELGGSDPYVVLADADVATAAQMSVKARMVNGGQSCVAAKRLIAVKEVHDAFLAAVEAHMKEAVLGDPHDPETTLGPMARVDLRDTLHAQVRKSVEAGAKLHFGGKPLDRPGAWYPATLLSAVGPGMPAYDEETFGPVAVVIRAEDTEDALRIAADTPYGLGAAVFTGRADEAERIARDELRAGCCFGNSMVRSDPRLPFGGIRNSGFGRELSAEGIRSFCNAKTVYVAKS